jgi:hypothetical protein
VADVTSAVFEQALSNLHVGAASRLSWPSHAANALADHWKREGRIARSAPGDLTNGNWGIRAASGFQLVDRPARRAAPGDQMRFVEGRSIREVAAVLNDRGRDKQLQLRAIDSSRA